MTGLDAGSCRSSLFFRHQAGGGNHEILNNQGYSYMLRGDLVNGRKKFLKAYQRNPIIRPLPITFNC